MVSGSEGSMVRDDIAVLPPCGCLMEGNVHCT